MDRPSLRLILMRHAKSSWKTDAPTDHARPLNKRGRADAPKMGAALRARGWVPDRVLSSDSERTRETFARMRGSLGYDGPVDFRPDLYHAGIDELREVVAAAPSEARTLLVLGHNPGWEEALAWLTGSDEPMKTGSAALLTTDAVTWAEALERPHAWTLEALVRPRDL